MTALTLIKPQSPLVDFERDVDLCDEQSGFEHSGTAGFNVETVNMGGHYFSRDIERTAKIAWMHIGRALLGRVDLIDVFGKEAVEAVEADATLYYDEEWG